MSFLSPPPAQIRQLADECGTAEATISRFCRTLKLKGFNAFKIELARHSATAGKVKQKEEPTKNTLIGRSLEVGRMANDAIYQTVSLVDPVQVEKAVRMIEDATQVLCFGAGGSTFGGVTGFRMHT